MLQQIRDMETAKNEENEGLRKRITELEESIDEGQKREKDMRSQIESKAESRIANLQNELAALESKLSEQNEERTSIISQKETDILDLQKKLEKAESENTEHNSTIESLRGENAELESDVGKGKADIVSLQQKIDEFEQESLKHQETIEKLRSENAELESEVGEGKADILSLQQNIDGLEQEKVKHQETIEKLREKNKDIESDIEERKSDIVSLQEKLDELEQENLKRQGTIDNLREENNALTSDLEQNDASLESVKMERDAVQSLHSALKVEMKEMKTALQKSEDSNKNLERQLAQQVMALKTIQLERDAVQSLHSALKVDMEEMKAALHTLENSKENLERQLAEQKMALKSVQKDKNDHEKKIIETTVRETMTRELLNELKTKVGKLDSENRELSIRNDILQNENKSSREKAEDLMAERGELKAQILLMKKSLEDANAEKEELQIELEELEQHQLELEQEQELGFSPFGDDQSSGLQDPSFVTTPTEKVSFDELHDDSPRTQLQDILAKLSTQRDEEAMLAADQRNAEEELEVESKLQKLRDEFECERSEMQMAQEMLQLKLTTAEARRIEEIATLKELKAEEINDLQIQLQKKTKALAEAESKIAEMLAAAEEKSEQIECASEESSALKLEIEALQKGSGENAEELTELREQYEIERKSHLELQEKLKAERRSYVELEEKFQAERTSYVELQEKFQAEIREHSTLSTTLVAKMKAHVALQNQLDSEVQSFEALKKRFDCEVESNEALKRKWHAEIESHAESRKEITNLQKRCKYLEEANPDLAYKLERIQQKLAEAESERSELLDIAINFEEENDNLKQHFQRTISDPGLTRDPVSTKLPDCLLWDTRVSDSSANMSMIADGESDPPAAVSLNAGPIAEWGCDDVLTWLTSIRKMESVLEVFHEEGIDGEMLLELDHDVLEEIGIERSYQDTILSGLDSLVKSRKPQANVPLLPTAASPTAPKPTATKEEVKIKTKARTTHSLDSMITESHLLGFMKDNGGKSIDKDVKTFFRSISGRKKEITLKQLKKGLVRFIPNKREEAARQKLVKIVPADKVQNRWKIWADGTSI